MYGQADSVFAYVILIPTIAAGKITLGTMNQILRAFGQVANSFQFLVNAWTTIIELMSIYKRLQAFEALIYEKEITLGVIYDFNRGMLYEGSVISKAKLNGEDISVSSIHDKSKATLATGLPAKGNFNKESMSELSNELVNWKKVRMIGSAAMSCAYVASGKFDQYQEKGIFLWDIAAGLSIIKAAGGNFTFKSYPEDQFKVDVIANNNCL